ncbi:MAG: hypothetical protein ACXVEF_28380 [Polyangiales bacterium]
MRRAFSCLVVSVGLLAATPAEAEHFEVVARGPVLSMGIGMSRAGYSLMFELGGESTGIRSFAHDRLLLSWDVLLAARVGQLANTEPYLTLFGVRGRSFIEPAYRTSEGAWSPVISTRLGADAIALFHPGVSYSELHTLNDMDGAGGVSARGLVRAGGGASFLDHDRSLLLQAFLQEHLDTGGVFKRGRAFTQLGFSARYDTPTGWMTYVEGMWGATTARESPGLGRTDRTTRMGISGSLRKVLGGIVWVGLDASLQRDTDHVVYEPSHTTFDTTDPGDFTLALSFGVSPWRAR